MEARLLAAFTAPFDEDAALAVLGTHAIGAEPVSQAARATLLQLGEAPDTASAPAAALLRFL